MTSFKPFLNQSYEEIKQKCIESNELFVDDLFPANEASIYTFKKKTKSEIVWKRPHDICQNPQFIVDSIVPNDLDQGEIGDCWLISACAAVATVPEYCNRVIPWQGQSFNESEYAGVFHFRLWRFGEWIDVVVDDYLPVDAETNSLVYCHNNKDTNEMFGPLLEKAFAKLNGCYEFLDGGDLVDSLIDMTGGVSESFSVKNNNSVVNSKFVEKTKLWEILFKSFAMKSLCGASIDAKGGQIEDIKANGLVLGHAYGVENAVELYSTNNSKLNALRLSTEASIPNSVKLLRMRNPWGEDVSYKGDWNSASARWDGVSDELHQKLQCFEKDGQFYISFKDFRLNFDEVQFVHTNMNAMYDEQDLGSDNHGIWQSKSFDGQWIPGINAGGCGNDNYENFWLNPQYLLTLNTNDKCSVIISLLQTEQERKRRETNGTYESSFEAMLFSVYSIKKPKSNSDYKKYSDRELTPLESITSSNTAAAPTYEFSRDFTRRYDLNPGQYIIIPSLFEKDCPMKYLLRFFVESTNFSLIELGSQPTNQNEQETNQYQETSVSYDQIENTENEPDPNQEETEYYETTSQQNYRSRVFEVPKFYQDQLSANVTRACSLM